uniref:Uncharacterized protein n=1 Tax=Setaria viridis TaxID=4556 RepID=A0A4U6WBN4_SETVI|nr:hypothetical protein SEVIR_1G165650v2 [Setaria viridis]
MPGWGPGVSSRVRAASYPGLGAPGGGSVKSGSRMDNVCSNNIK